MAAQTKQSNQIQKNHPMTGVQVYFKSLWDALEQIPDPAIRTQARNTLRAAWNDLSMLMDHAQREIQNGDALVEAALAAATSLSQQRAEAVREIERLQSHMDAGAAETYAVVMGSIAAEIGNAMGIGPEAARLLFDSLIGDLDDFPDAHGISGEQIHAFRSAMVTMLRALKGG